MEFIGPYQVVRCLGAGGMGAVYEVRHPEVSRPLALKVMGEALCDEEGRERFQREGQALAALSHPNVVSVHTLRELDGQLVLVTELVEGQPLAERLSSGPLSPNDARRILSQLASAVAALHDLGLIHRDLKPDNVLLRPDGSPVLIDFGLARAASGSSLTKTGEILGTPGYMAPEQARDASRAAEASDVFALGALLFACLAGYPPFRGASTLEVLDRLLSSPPEWPQTARDWPPELRRLCERALAKEPAQRPASAREFREALAPDGPRLHGAWRAAGVGGLVLGAGIAAVVGSWALQRLQPTPALPVDSIRSGVASIPSVSVGDSETLAWSALGALLAGVPPDPSWERLARGEAPAAQALAAGLAALSGDAQETRRLLRLHGLPARPEVRLLPALADARAGKLRKRQVPALLELLAEVRGPLPSEARGLRAVARLVGGQAPVALLPEPQLPRWAVARILVSCGEGLLESEALQLLATHASALSPEERRGLVTRVTAALLSLVPEETTPRDYAPEEIRRLTAAVRAYRALVPLPTPLPGETALRPFALRLIDFDAEDDARRVPLEGHDLDFAIALADSVSSEAGGLVQTVVAMAIWQREPATPERWRGILRATRREAQVLQSQDDLVHLELKRAGLRSRLSLLLLALNEDLPAPARDPAELGEAARLLRAPKGHPDPRRSIHAEDDPRASEALALYAEILAEPPELRLAPARRQARRAALELALEHNPRMTRVRVALLYGLEPDAALSGARGLLDSPPTREAQPGALLNRVAEDIVWPTRAAAPSKCAEVLALYAQALDPLHLARALRWRLRAASLTPAQPSAEQQLNAAREQLRAARHPALAAQVEAAREDPQRLLELAERCLLEVPQGLKDH